MTYFGNESLTSAGSGMRAGSEVRREYYLAARD